MRDLLRPAIGAAAVVSLLSAGVAVYQIARALALGKIAANRYS
jgi:hypothetical protein